MLAIVIILRLTDPDPPLPSINSGGVNDQGLNDAAPHEEPLSQEEVKQIRAALAEEDDPAKRLEELKRSARIVANELARIARNPREPQESRASAMRMLGEYEPSIALDHLAALAADWALADPMRVQAIYELAKVEDDRTFDRLTHLYQTGRNFAGRYHIIHKLGGLGDDRAVPVLIEALQRDPDDSVKNHAAKHLGRFPEDDRARAALLQAARSNPNRSVRMNAIRQLARFEGDEVEQTLQAIASSPLEDEKNRKLAENILHRRR